MDTFAARRVCGSLPVPTSSLPPLLSLHGWGEGCSPRKTRLWNLQTIFWRLSVCPSPRVCRVAAFSPFPHPFSRAGAAFLGFPWQEQCDNPCCIPILQNQQQQGGHREPQNLEPCQLASPCLWWHPLGLELIFSTLCFVLFHVCGALEEPSAPGWVSVDLDPLSQTASRGHSQRWACFPWSEVSSCSSHRLMPRKADELVLAAASSTAVMWQPGWVGSMGSTPLFL